MEKLFGGFHLIFLGISILVIVLSNIIIKKKKLNEKTIDLIIKIEAVLWLISILINRVVVTAHNIEANPANTWLSIIPNSFCGFCSLVLSLTVLFGKKDNIIFHSIGYLGLVGGAATMIYPDFLNTQSFFDPRSLSGLLHHAFMVGIIIKLFIYGYFTPTISKCSYFILGLCVLMTYGAVEYDALGFDKAMQIGKPFISSLPILTSWYIIYLVLIIAHFIFLVLYEKFKNKLTWKEIFMKLRHK